MYNTFYRRAPVNECNHFKMHLFGNNDFENLKSWNYCKTPFLHSQRHNISINTESWTVFNFSFRPRIAIIM